MRSLRQVQASSGLLYDVLRRYDPDHLLLAQAEREVFERQLEAPRLMAALRDCERRTLALCAPRALTPGQEPPVPPHRHRGATQDDLQRLARLVAAIDARELWIVGDVLYGPAGQAGWREAWEDWRGRHGGLDIAVLGAASRWRCVSTGAWSRYGSREQKP